jgi:hypothetical protein
MPFARLKRWWRRRRQDMRAVLPLAPNDPDADLERFFTDAEEARSRFDQLIRTAPLEKQILIIHGVGAVGKSSLLKMFRLTCRRQGLPVGLVAAEDAPSVVDLLDRGPRTYARGGWDCPLLLTRSIGITVCSERSKTRRARRDRP